MLWFAFHFTPPNSFAEVLAERESKPNNREQIRVTFIHTWTVFEVILFNHVIKDPD